MRYEHRRRTLQPKQHSCHYVEVNNLLLRAQFSLTTYVVLRERERKSMNIECIELTVSLQLYIFTSYNAGIQSGGVYNLNAPFLVNKDA